MPASGKMGVKVTVEIGLEQKYLERIGRVCVALLFAVVEKGRRE